MKSLTMWISDAKDGSQEMPFGDDLKTRAKTAVKKALGRYTPPPEIDTKAQRLEGRDWPSLACTMIGLKRIQNVKDCVESAIKDGIPGDLIETGVWRGGTTIFMRGILKAYGIADRKVFVADSFEGLPPPDLERYPQEKGDIHYTLDQLAVGLEAVQANFRNYGLLDDQVVFLKGWFKDTLPSIPTQKLAVIRMDGDMYGSTMDAFVHLYPKLSVGGYVLVDDVGAVPACKQAVDDYRAQHGITDPILPVDWTGIYWRKSR